MPRMHTPNRYTASASRLGPESAAHGELVEAIITPINIDTILLQALDATFGPADDSKTQRTNVYDGMQLALQKATELNAALVKTRAGNKNQIDILDIEHERASYTRRILGKDQKEAQYYREVSELVKVELQRQVSKELNHGTPDSFYLDQAREKFAAVLYTVKGFTALRGERLTQKLDSEISARVTEALHHPEHYQGKAFSALSMAIPRP